MTEESFDALAREELRQLRRAAALALVAPALLHDLNDALTPILILSERLTRALDHGSSSAMIAADIQAASSLAAGLVRDLLAFARSQPPCIERVDINEVVRQMTNMMGRLLGDRTRIELELTADALFVVVDRRRLEHGILSLIVHARDFAPHTDGRLLMSSKVVGAAGDSERHVALALRRELGTSRGHDNGVGHLGPFDIGTDLVIVRAFARESGGALAVDDPKTSDAAFHTVTLFLPWAGR